jgi:hypothetical protein
MLFRIGIKSLPLSVKVYSTRGGTSAKHCLVMIFMCSNSSKRCDKVRGLIPCKEFSKIENRAEPLDSSIIIKGVHLLPITTNAPTTQPGCFSILGFVLTISCIVTLLCVVLVMLILYKL